MRFRSVISGLVLLSLLVMAGPAGADDARSAIEAAYSKSYKAASLRHLEGILSVRARDFVAYDLEGKPIEPRKELAMLYTMVSSALKLEESGEILEFKQLSPKKVECKVLDRLLFTGRESKTGKARTLLFTTRSSDVWVLGEQGWKQSSSRVLEQDVRPHDAAESGGEVERATGQLRLASVDRRRQPQCVAGAAGLYLCAPRAAVWVAPF